MPQSQPGRSLASEAPPASASGRTLARQPAFADLIKHQETTVREQDACASPAQCRVRLPHAAHHLARPRRLPQGRVAILAIAPASSPPAWIAGTLDGLGASAQAGCQDDPASARRIAVHWRPGRVLGGTEENAEGPAWPDLVGVRRGPAGGSWDASPGQLLPSTGLPPPAHQTSRGQRPPPAPCWWPPPAQPLLKRPAELMNLSQSHLPDCCSKDGRRCGRLFIAPILRHWRMTVPPTAPSTRRPWSAAAARRKPGGIRLAHRGVLFHQVNCRVASRHRSWDSAGR